MFAFALQEIEEKKRRLRSFMARNGLSALYLKKTANVAWLTGGAYTIVGFATELGVAGILLTHDDGFVICSNIEAPRMRDEERLAEQGYKILSFPWYEDREAELVHEHGGAAIGADCPLKGTSDISSQIAPLRYSLTPWEIERYAVQARETARIAEETAMAIRPGDTEQKVVGQLSARLWEAGMDFIVAFCAADDRIAQYRHPIATDRRIESRAMISVNSRKRGLIVSITRFIQFGPVPADIKKRYEDNVYVDCSMMAATIPGRAASTVFEAALCAYAERGYPEEYRLHHQGGAIGYIGRDYKVTAATKDIIQENQAFAWNPSITGVKSEDTMLATSNGPVVLSEPVLFPVLEREKDGYLFRRPAIMKL